MSSGVSVNQDCVTVFNEIKLGHKFRYVIYSLNDDLTQCTYDDFVDDLKEAESSRQCRYGVFDAQYQLNDGQQRNKLVFFLWSPENATIKQKMVYTSSKVALRKGLVGVGKEIQACDYGDLAWSNVMETLLRTEVAQ
ncbi:hypothetical protein HELRODRAFT_162169 [Helobdella robusta]|uniref:ADF-H domain-containing protein n=1 Tax=Helobdella robusta TaxID=6412 RepID=T1ESB4_HELRO|nr:hypothetical protein HELRODRAFT_162169 [Helobdella robusta]ESN98719.1 hypothetical protein HELRODRAFT_162169 [Helobdella robusta]